MAMGDQSDIQRNNISKHHQNGQPITVETGKAATEPLQAKCTHHAPRKRLLTKLQALVTSPKRAYGRAERDGLGAIAGAFHKRDSISAEQPETKYRERLASDASLNSGSSAGPRSITSPGSSTHHVLHTPAGTTPSASPLSPPASGSPEAPYLTSSPVKRQDGAPSLPNSEPQTCSQSPRNDSTATKADSAQDNARIQPLAEDAESPQVLLRPHLKLRIVTWNMHDSLPTGDLTELLGSPSAACDSATVKARPMPFDPEHVLQPLSSGLEHEAPYHLVVVGGQEVPVGYGGWSGPNWTETIQRWLSGGTFNGSNDTVPQTPTEKANVLAPEGSTERGPVSPSSPNTAHRQFLDAQISETLALPDDAIDVPEEHDADALNEKAKGSTTEVLQRDMIQKQAGPSASASQQPPGDGFRSTPMARNDSSDTTNTDRSLLTDTSAQTGGGLVTSEQNVLAEASQEDALLAGGKPPPYILVTKERLMGIYCSLWVHSSCAHLVQGSSTGTVTAGLLAGKLGNKGAACISLKIVDTRFLFVCAHLAAHSERSALRQANVKKIKEELVIDTFLEQQDRPDKGRLKRGLSLSKPANEKTSAAKLLSVKTHDGQASRQDSLTGVDITELFDHTFWFGDLNFRLDISRLHADFLINEQKYETALTFDQLGPILKDPKGCFQGFAEAPIKFAPSYKYDVLKLKRSRTVQKSHTGSSGLGLALGERRGVGQILSPTAPTSVNASRTNLITDTFNEEEEGDERSIADRNTVASSRVSISSTFSGFEKSFGDNENIADQETLANTSYNHRVSAGFFGSSIPSTPTTDKVLDKARGFFHLIRGRSPAPGHSQNTDLMPPDTEEDRPLKVDPESQERIGTVAEPSLLSPLDVGTSSQAERFAVPAGPSQRAQTPTTDGHSFSSANYRMDPRAIDADPSLRRPSLEIPAERGQPGNMVRSTTPILSPRPRLKSMRSTNTVLSMSSIGFGKSMSSSMQNQQAQEGGSQEATYDTSSKKRVQSWTDRILYKSKIVVEEETRTSRSLVNGSLIPSLRSISRTIRDHHHRDSGPAQDDSPGTADPPARVSFRVAGPVEQADQDQNTTLYQRQNSSTSSLVDAQQGPNGRLANLLRRRSSGGRVDSVPEEAVTPSPTPVVGRLGRARSLQSRSRRSSLSGNASPVSVNFRPRSSPSPVGVEHRNSLHGRTKPHRAYTSPLPVGPLNDHRSSAVTQRDLPSASRTPIIQSTGQQRPSAAVSPPPSADMARHGSEPLAKTSPSRSASEEQLRRTTTFDTDRLKRSFPFYNPFSRAAPTQFTRTPADLVDSPLRPCAEGAGKTKIVLSHSKTTPISHSSAQVDERPHLGLRHWWNARLLPHIFSSHVDEPVEDASDDVQIGGLSDQATGLPPAPVVIGPRRGEIQCIYYDSVADLRRMEACSDHRPVVAVFAVGV